MERRKFNFKGILTVVLTGILSFSGFVNIWRINAAFGLSYQQDIGVSFTFNPTINLTLSSADIYINNLVPGTVSDSNIITVNVSTNAINGYTLNATVGNNSTFNTRDLIYKGTSVSDKFSSVDFGASLVSNTDLADNAWAYSFLDESLNNGTNTTWANYSGLPLYSDTVNVATIKTSTMPVSSTGGDSVKFKIAARASNTISSGEYNNVINFTVVAAPVPKTLAMAYEDAGKTKYNGYYKMQDMTNEICNSTDVIGEGSVTELIDVRDNSVYTATKLADSKCWMTKNLRLDFSNLVEDISVTNTNNPTATFIAEAAAHPATTNPSAAMPWCNVSSTACVNQLLYSTINLGDATIDSTGHAYNEYGVYYNWYTATAGNGTYEMTSGSTVGDLCPYGWRLPTGTDSGDFYKLNQAINDGSLSSPVGFLASPANFVYSGGISESSVISRDTSGSYWSSTVNDSGSAHNLGFTDSFVNPGTYGYFKSRGLMVRCVTGS